MDGADEIGTGTNISLNLPREFPRSPKLSQPAVVERGPGFPPKPPVETSLL